MIIADIIRQQTYEIRDTSIIIEQQISRSRSDRDAYEERRKRLTTEISKQGENEREARKILSNITGKISKIKEDLEELDRKRQEIIDALFQCQEEQATKEKYLRNAQSVYEKTLAEYKNEEKAKQEAENRVFELQTEFENIQNLLRQKLQESMNIYLKAQADQLQKAFLSEEQKAKQRREQEEFQKARHNNPEIAVMCEQREELLKFINSSMVPAVKQTLQISLKEIEEQLAKRYPVAVLTGNPLSKDNKIEELLYYINQEGKAVLLLPITEVDWNNAQNEDIVEQTSRALCFVWNMISELKLKTQDGQFLIRSGFIVFETCLALEEVAILQDFSVCCGKSTVSRFVLTAMPAELQAVVSHEN